jgi:chromosome segregation ATPase
MASESKDIDLEDPITIESGVSPLPGIGIKRLREEKEVSPDLPPAKRAETELNQNILGSLLTQKVQLQAQIKLLKEQIDTKHQEITSLSTDRDRLNSELEVCNDQRGLLQTQIEKLKAQKLDLEDELEDERSLQKEIIAAKDQQIAELQARLENSDSLLTRSKTDIETLQANIQQVIREKDDLTATCSARIQELEQEINRLSKTLYDLNAQFVEAIKRIGELEKANKDLRIQIYDLQQEKTKTFEELNQTKLQVVEAKSQLSNCELQNNLLKKRCEAEIENLNKQLDIIRAQNDVLADEKALLLEKNLTISQLYNPLLERYNGLITAYEKGSVDAKLLRQNEEYTIQFNSLTEQKNKVEVELDRIKRQMETNKLQMKSLELAIDDQNKTIFRMKIENATIQEQLSSCTAKQEIQASEITRMRKEAIEQFAKHAAEIDALQKQIDALQKQIKTLQTEKVGLEDQLKRSTALLSGFSVKSEALTSEINILKERILELEIEIGRKDQEIRKKDQDIKNFSGRIILLNKKVSNLEKQLKTCNANLTSKEDIVKTTNEKLDKCNTKVVQCEKDLEQRKNTEPITQFQRSWLLISLTLIAGFIGFYVLLNTYSNLKKPQNGLFINENNLLCYSEVVNYNRNVLLAYLAILTCLFFMSVLLIVNPSALQTYIVFLVIILISLGYAGFNSISIIKYVDDNKQKCIADGKIFYQGLAYLQLVISLFLLFFMSFILIYVIRLLKSPATI